MLCQIAKVYLNGAHQMRKQHTHYSDKVTNMTVQK